MKARIFSLLLIVALLVSVSVFAVEAETTFDPTTTTTCPMCGEENVTWTAYATQKTSGHYYLADNYTMTSQVDLGAGVMLCLHLNGKTLTAKDGNRAFLLNMGTSGTVKPVLNLMGGTVQGGATRFGAGTDGNANDNGGLFYLHANGAELNIHDGVTLNATAATEYKYGGSGSVIYAGKGATVTMYGGTINGPATTTSQGMNGGAVYVTGGTFNFYGGTINGNLTNKGGALSLFGGAQFTMGYPAAQQPNGYVVPVMNGANASRNGGTVFMSDANTKFILNAGTINGGKQTTGSAQISNNVPTYREGGGNIFMQSSAIFEMNGGQILGGEAAVSTGGFGGGAVCLRTGATFTMNDGVIQGKRSAYAGNSVFVADEGSVFNLVKGTIKAGTSSSVRGGAVAVYAKGTLNVGKADGSSVAEDAKIIFATDSAATTNGGLIICSDSGTAVNLYKGAYLSGGVSSGANKEVGGGNIYNCASATVNMHGGTITGGTAQYTGSVYNGAIFNMYGGEIIGGVATQFGGNIYNNGTFTMTGGTITGGTAVNGGNVYVNSGTFVLDGGIISGGMATGTAAEGENAAVNGYGGNVYNKATFNLKSGTISGGKQATDGQPIDGANVYTSKTFTMEGGKIEEGTGMHGAGVELVGGTFTMEAGEIKNNTVTGYGGNVNVYAGEFIMNDGTISNGTETVNALNGGNVYNGKTFTMNGGAISGGYAYNPAGSITGGGAVYNAADATFTLNDGTISGGKSLFGGNLENYGTFDMNGGKICDGEVFNLSGTGGGNGGNIRANSGGTVTIAGGEIYDGTCPTYGGNVYVNGGTVNFTNGTIKNGTAGGGGNVFVISGTFTMSQAEGKTTQILGGTCGTGYNGGSVSLRGGIFNLQGGTVDATDATCPTNGGAISVGWSAGSATLNMSGGTVKGGSAKCGGNIYVTAKGIVNMTGGTIQDGYATGTATGASSTVGGGNVFVSGGSFTMSGESTIKDGTAVHSGGNVKVNGGKFQMDNGTVSGGANEFTTNNGLVGGGNFNVVAGELDINGGTVSGGVAVNYTNGGNILLTNGTVNIDNATVQVTGDTKAAANGPNIYVRNGTSTLNIGEGAILTDEGYTQSGSARNIYVHSGLVNINGGEIRSYSGGSSILVYGNGSLTGATLTVNGGTIINKGTTGASGKNIYVDNGTLILNGGKLMNGMVGGTSVNMNGANTAKIAITLSGNAWVDQLVIPNAKDTQPSVTVAADFTGCAYLRPTNTEIYEAVTYGWSVTQNTKVTVAETYANTGSLFVGAKLGVNADYLPAAYSEGNLYITGLTKVVDGMMFDHAATTVEIQKELPIVSADDVGEGEALKIWNTAEAVTLTKDTTVNTNGQNVTINASNGAMISLIDTTNDKFTGTPGKVTVNGDNVENYVITEEGKRYIAVKNADGTYSAHRIEARLKQVSIRPSAVGVYYSVEITCDATLEALVTNYGVAVSLNSMPDASFLGLTPREDILYTYISVNDNSFKSGSYHGALVTGIMTTGEIAQGAPTNEARANMPVYANAFVVVANTGVGEGDVLVMADHDNMGLVKDETGWKAETAIAMSLTDIMSKVNEEAKFNALTDTAKASVQNFYNTWKSAANWTFTTIENWVDPSTKEE